MRDGKRTERPPIRTVMHAIERATRMRARQTLQPMSIDNCRTGDRCPGHWHALVDDGRLDSRACGTCQRRVQLCVSRKEQREQVEAGHPVVFYRDLWPTGHAALRARRQILERHAPPEVLPGLVRSAAPKS
jgi:hypothetical protein